MIVQPRSQHRANRKRKVSQVKETARTTTNLNLLLNDLRNKLGLHWTFFQEGLEGALRAVMRKEDMTAWVTQMNQVVQGRDDLDFSYKGVLFLLDEMGAEAKSASIHLAVPPIPVHGSTLTSLSLRRMPSFASDVQPSARPLSNTAFMYPSNTTTSVPSSRLFAASPAQGKMLAAAPSAMDIDKSENEWSLQNDSNAIFFVDADFKREVQDFFRSGQRREDGVQHTVHADYYHQLTLPYKADADDLDAWKSGANYCREERGTYTPVNK